MPGALWLSPVPSPLDAPPALSIGSEQSFALAFFIRPGTGRAEPDYVGRRQKARLLPAAQCRWRFAPFGKPASLE